jgi:hypothetical protein
MAYTVPDPYPAAVRTGFGLSWRVDAYRAGVAVPGATGLVPDESNGGSIEDDATRDGRRTLDLGLPPTPGLFDLLAPIGTTLRVYADILYLDQSRATIPCGVYEVDTQSMGMVSGTVRINAPDKWARVKRARFLAPQTSTRGAPVTTQIAALLRGALGAGEAVNVTATSTATVGALVWDRDRDAAILDLAKSIGAWVYFDRDGTATVADLPTIGPTPNWTVDAGARGVLTSMQRSRSRERTYNVVKVISTRSDGAAVLPPQTVWDSDPASPTYAGTDPFGHPELAGPFGVVPYFYESTLFTNITQMQNAGRKILARTAGLASNPVMGVSPNPAMDALDVLNLIPPPERPDLPRPLEQQMADKITHALDVTSEVTIQGRSTRTDEYA